MIFRERKSGGSMNVAWTAIPHHDTIIRWHGRFRRVVRFG